jgi:hypothetical protein
MSLSSLLNYPLSIFFLRLESSVFGAILSIIFSLDDQYIHAARKIYGVPAKPSTRIEFRVL